MSLTYVLYNSTNAVKRPEIILLNNDTVITLGIVQTTIGLYLENTL